MSGQEPKKSLVIPPHARPVGFMISAADGTSYKTFQTLKEARRHRDAVLIMEADSGGQILLTCSISTVAATHEALLQLLVDLETIAWGRGFDPEAHGPPCEAAMYFEPLPIGSGVWGGMGGGAVVEGLWLHAELDRVLAIREEVLAVITGRMSRIDLPAGFPHTPLKTLEHAKRSSKGIVLLRSPDGKWLLAKIAAHQVRCSQPQIVQLAQDIASELGLAAQSSMPDSQVFPVEFRIEGDWGPERWGPPSTRLPYDLPTPLQKAIRRVLRGDQSRLKDTV